MPASASVIRPMHGRIARTLAHPCAAIREVRICVVISVWSKGKVHTTRVATVVVAACSETDVVVEGRDHGGAIVLALHASPEEAHALCVRLGGVVKARP